MFNRRIYATQRYKKFLGGCLYVLSDKHIVYYYACICLYMLIAAQIDVQAYKHIEYIYIYDYASSLYKLVVAFISDIRYQIIYIAILYKSKKLKSLISDNLYCYTI